MLNAVASAGFRGYAKETIRCSLRAVEHWQGPVTGKIKEVLEAIATS